MAILVTKVKPVEAKGPILGTWFMGVVWMCWVFKNLGPSEQLKTEAERCEWKLDLGIMH